MPSRKMNLRTPQTTTRNRATAHLVYMNGCIHCVRFKPVFDKFARTNANRFEFKVQEKDEFLQDQAQGLQSRFIHPEGFPSTYIFDKYGNLTDTITGFGPDTLNTIAQALVNAEHKA